MRGFTDIHAHFVYGLDDGAKTRQDMEDMLDAAAADGVTRLIATPHMTPGVYPFPAERLAAHLEAARDYCALMGYPLRLSSAAEVLFNPMLERYIRDHPLPTYGDGETVLLEFVPDISYSEASDALELLERNGYRVILAHIERYDFMFHGRNAYRLQEGQDVRYQVNCATVVKGLGFRKDRTVHKWFQDSLIDFVASDTHSRAHRPTMLRESYAILSKKYGIAYAQRLTGGLAPVHT